ncbi:MAG: hypothetical protein U5K74_03555 [Gemmatimonadaceae bacterium]|nr:hypothetical protein [Gemmatimonadaceae bacterium]
MRDMTRDELQDCMPDLLCGRLGAEQAATVERAIAADPELAEELALLRRVRNAHGAAPSFDVSRIVSALPSPPSVVVAPPVDDLAERRNAKRRPLISQRFARAAALVVVVGGGTLATLWNGSAGTAGGRTTVTRAESVAVGIPATMQLGLGASTDDLSVEQLRALEADIEALDGVPSADPEFLSDLLPGEGA